MSVNQACFPVATMARVLGGWIQLVVATLWGGMLGWQVGVGQIVRCGASCVRQDDLRSRSRRTGGVFGY